MFLDHLLRNRSDINEYRRCNVHHNNGVSDCLYFDNRYFILFFCINLLLSKVALPPGMVVSDRGAITNMKAIINAEIIFGQIGDRDGRRNRAKAGII